MNNWRLLSCTIAGFRHRLRTRRTLRRAWSDLYAELDAHTKSRLDTWDQHPPPPANDHRKHP